MRNKVFLATLLLGALALTSCGQINVIPLKKVENQQPGSATLAWDEPSPSDPSIVGYRLYYGTASGDYTEVIDAGRKFEIDVENLPRTMLYFAVTAYAWGGAESAFSNEVTLDLTNKPHPIKALR